MSNKFNYKVVTHPAKPRSERRQSAGEGSSSGSTIIVGGDSSAGDGHIHANKTALDAISIDGSNYLKLTQKPDGASESVTAKVKAGYADKAAMADYATQAGNADMWDNLDAADYLDQPVRTTDEVAFKKVVTSTLETPNWQTGALGGGLKLFEDENGNGVAIVDKLQVRQEARFNVLTIEELRSISGAIIVSPANAIITNVENLGSAYRCYYKPKSGAQMWRVGDQARCQRFTGDGLKYYWRLVTSVSTDANEQGEHSFNLSASTADGSGIPSMNDEVVLLGHRGTDNSRKNAIVISSGSFDNVTPYIYSYKNITNFSLEGKRNIKIDDEPEFKCKKFTIASDDGNEYQIPRERGGWIAGSYAYYDRVSHLGSLWLCVAPNGTSVPPSDLSSDIWLKEVQKGNDGEGWKYQVQLFKWSPQKPVKPVGSEHNGWSRNSVKGSALTTSDGKLLTANGMALMSAYPDDYKLWGCQGVFDGHDDTLIGDWVDVYQMSGDDGRDGRDGKDYEYIFACTIDEVKPGTPATVQRDDYVPSGWTDDAQGVTAALRFEWSCKRMKIAGVWGDFSRPALWARFSEDGADGQNGTKGDKGDKGNKGDDGKDVDPVLADQKKFEAIETFFGGAVDRETIESVMAGTAAPFEVKNGVVLIRDALVKNLAAMEAFVENLVARKLKTSDSGVRLEIMHPYVTPELTPIMRIFESNNHETIRIYQGYAMDGSGAGIQPSINVNNGAESVQLGPTGLTFPKSVAKYESKGITLPNTAVINMPGVLCAGSVSSGGVKDRGWGAKVWDSVKHNGQDGKYKITHSIGHLDYFTTANIVSTGFVGSVMVLEKTISHVILGTAGLDGNFYNNAFEFQICGKN